jgi:hypothetical protein
VHYKGRSIDEVLDMTVEAAHEFFSSVPSIARKLATLLEVGLGYIKLGQSATTLSGGEAQRVKLSLELSKRDTGRTLFILDEPTTDCTSHDIDLLLKVLHRLRDHGNTVIVIEHNLDVVKTADWLIDLGPEGGDGGGRVVAQGTPEEVIRVAESFTGRFLAPILAPSPRRRAGCRLMADARELLLASFRTAVAGRRSPPNRSRAPAQAASRAHRRGRSRQGGRRDGARGRARMARRGEARGRGHHPLRDTGFPRAASVSSRRATPCPTSRARGRRGRSSSARARSVRTTSSWSSCPAAARPCSRFPCLRCRWPT